MLTLENVRLTLDDFRLTANLTLPSPGVTAVLGPSGAGKSTLLHLIAGFLHPDNGRILWNGEDITEDAPADRPMSIIFQDNNLFPHLDVLTNVVLGASVARRPEPEIVDRATLALDQVGLGGMEERKPAQLSGGQQSRVALARVLLSDRPLLLLDEPFSALGPALRREMLALTTRLAAERGAGVLMVTHDPRDARDVAERIVFVDAGAVHAPVPTEDLFADPPPALRDYIG